ncbi:MAG: hypothetical protein M1814_001995 [Vezdaea aestivalis]|nr:MAG: hypothetical protein M1814_001995 [Vezdaea aestivalis]
MSFLRHPLTALGVQLSALAGTTCLLRAHHIYNLEEHEARMDELEGTLRGHIGIIEEALDRLEGKATEADRGKKIHRYLTLRGIGYKQCVQLAVMPRKDLSLLGIRYRRIPLLAIGRHIYCDSRLILVELERRFPDGALGQDSPTAKAVEELLRRVVTDGVFLKDQEDLTGRSWDEASLQKSRPQALAEILEVFTVMETTLFSDDRDWVLGGVRLSLADIEAVWPFHWLAGLPGALPPGSISKDTIPKVFGWINRFDQKLSVARKRTAKPRKLNGNESAEQILATPLASDSSRLAVDESHPLQFKKLEEVEIWPVDSGLKHRQRGRLLMLTVNEIGVQTTTEVAGKTVILHFPRHGYRLQHVGGSDAKL